ncbi:MAG: type II and III secretion system protein family protein [Rhodospirillaceae bacterium]|jgi:pilus assembly protein CpaC|nr:type II and III secretion system protein family protein [Rhodospirillaceae bacterium]MBT5244322.1 type II and III secretion system protein family protein [Rhodospirillaceae bacterium]MBT5563683.1 type II and III secretion system protein family protein [Rhodospirillaceae bacterium]MBT6241513.1 type II and III secretion system protein family protein [Rhodospirillaceae bacterium]MBT7137071.1 type II and III secretion system protein family protein [Rhodospirillaceae bacterium]
MTNKKSMPLTTRLSGFVLIAAFALVMSASAAKAQQVASTTTGPLKLQASVGQQIQFTRPSGTVDVVSSSGQSLELEVSKGRLIRLDRPAQTVFVADPEIANIQVKSPSLIYLLGKKPGQTTLYAVDSKERVLANIDITVTHNLGRLRGILDELHPGSGVRVASINGTLVLDGTVPSASAAEDMRRLAASFAGDEKNIINRLGITAPNQVNLRVRVAEVSRGVDKQLGFNWSILGSIGGFSLGLATTNPFAGAVTQNTLSLGKNIAGWDFNTVIDALEEEGLVSVLAEPNLTALSGETASFLAGGEFPILVPDSDGRVTIEFKKFGVSLAFTPTLLGEDRVNMHVRPEVSQLSSTNSVTLNSFVVPSLTTRRAETTVELGSGQSFAIAGLLQNNVTHDISKFPGLGDVPVLGGLFKSDRFQRDESELVIIITPYIVKPVSNNKLAAPTDGFAPPHDIERIFTGGVNRRNPNPGQPVTVGRGGKTLIGPVGFQLD